MAGHNARSSSRQAQKERDKKLLRDAKSWLIEQLDGQGVEENPRELTVCMPRKSRGAKLAGTAT